MRTLLTVAFALSLAACGKGSILEISCGTDGKLCDVSGSNVCCVGQSSAACTTQISCSGAPAFRCVGAELCGSGMHCCVNDLESRCAPACQGAETQACDTNADCPSGMTCMTRTYTSTSGAPLFSISLCQ